MEGIEACVLAGGLGTRLRSVMPDRPKVLAEVDGRPFVTRLLDQLAAAGVRRVVLCTGHLSEEVEGALGGSYRGLELDYSVETEPLGTGGALRLVLGRTSARTLLVLNGDSYFDLDLASFVTAFESSGARAAIALARVEDAGRYGAVRLGEGGRVLAFEEKRHDAGGGWINAGIYLLRRELLEALPSGPVSLERQVFPRWSGEDLYGHPSEGAFLDIGTPESLASAAGFFERLGSGRRSRFVALDRDGTLIESHHYLCDPDLVRLLPGAGEGLRAMRSLGLGLVVVTNQSAIGRGLLDDDGLEAIHLRLERALEAEGVRLDGLYACPHLPEAGCACRKPGRALFDRAADEHRFDSRGAFVIGDNVCDIELGRAVGATTFLVRSGHGERLAREGSVDPDHIVTDLREAAELMQDILDRTDGPNR